MIRNKFGEFSDMGTQHMLAPIQFTNIADRDYPEGKAFIFNNEVYRALTAISEGSTIIIYPDTNYNAVLLGYITDVVQDIGEIKAFMRNSAPPGYLKCDGSTYPIGSYPLLEQMFIDEFNSVNYFGGTAGSTFAVPDLRGEFLRGTGGNGSNVGIHQNQGLPNITGMFGHANTHNPGTQPSGCLQIVTQSSTESFAMATQTNTATYKIDASRSSSIYGKSSNVTPTNTSVLYCIKAYLV